MKLKLKNIDKFHRLKQMIPQLIRNTIDNSEVIHGARAINQQIRSPHLRTQTRDYDIYSEHPQQSARDTEAYLDQQFGFDAFEVQKGKHPGTYKVRARANSKTYADFTRPEKKILSRVINGKRYSTLGYHIKHAQETIRKGTATHRQGADQDIINRIKLSRRQNIQW